MIKKLISLVALSFLVSCTASVSLNGDPNYSGFVGKQYKTKSDLAVVKGEGGKVLYFPGEEGIPKVEEMKSFPFDYYGKTIYGVLPLGSLLRVSDIRRTKSVEWNMVDYRVTVDDAGQFQGQELLAVMLTDQNAKPVPHLDQRYVEEVLLTK